ncbi:DUF421 domain-containing protein [Pacificimonas flava]|uniref:DUF421 domain-containing protein n=2 Tax=Pacificimonas TaxID=1960290 RepID=A0A219B9F7_9SPHN|nr:MULTISPECIES: YetF domain-containing protein [Pacificimonas]MBZ6378402.1 DUF421 domain-containing protein [Pacificimonas aurantium]OWV34783.1 DUF421 domain-containing protein [Pacificimonas flava]
MSKLNLWIEDPLRLFEIAAGAAIFYLYIVLIVRLMGKRTTSQMNSFDWIINITVGSIAASGILLKNVSFFGALLAIAVLALCQWLTTKLAMNSALFRRVLKAEPRLLVHKGRFLRDAMARERVSEDEIMAKLREQGMSRVGDANWVVLETYGAMSVIPREQIGLDEASLLENVTGGPPRSP